MKLSFFSADLVEEEEGRWCNLLGAEPVQFKIRSLHCDDVQEWIANETLRLQKVHDTLELDGKTQSLLFRRAVAEKLLVGWSGILDDSGEVLIFTRAKAMEIMVERQWRRLSDAVSTIVVNRSKILFEERDTLGKVSENLSAIDSPSLSSPTPIGE
jgi:hypothetical protein